MPVYEYECEACGHRFELRRSMSDSDDEVECPACGTKKPKRVFSVFGTSGSSADLSASACSPGGRFT